ncbi:MAG: hypothetical protein RLZZ426_1012 [Actinomycetota bacterium]|jgi:NAD(P)-dependent dehydrogenase (short-subunit alcohol dehydrogenase family)
MLGGMTSQTQLIRWTADAIPDIRGKHFVVTGGNSGLGLVTVKELARRGATVTLACRNLTKGKTARDEIAAEVGPVEIDVRELDLASLVSIRDFAAHLSTSPIDVLINNAGVMAPPRSETIDGFELQFGTNHLGHFALTGHLWAGLMKSENPRVITVSSNAHKAGTMNFDDLMSQNKYSAWSAYGMSKLANLLFTFELQRRANAANISNFKSIAAHPGYSATNLSMSIAPSVGGFIRSAARSLESAVAQSAEMGALPQLYAATSLEVPAGAYVGPDGWGEWRGFPKLVSATEKAKSGEDAKLLWERSETLTGVSFL